MARVSNRHWAGLLLLGVTAIAVSVLAVAGVFANSESHVPAPQATRVPELFGMTKARAVRALKAAHLRPVVQLTRHTKNQPSGIVVAVAGIHPTKVGAGQSVWVASERGIVALIVSR